MAPDPPDRGTSVRVREALASESFLLVVSAVVLGVAAGSGVYLFKQAILAVHDFAYGRGMGALPEPWGWLVAIVPAVGGLLVGLIGLWFLGEERYAGVTGIMESVALAGGRLRWKRMPVKAVAAAVSIGSGASVGPEDPSVQIGASVGSFLGQRLHLSDDRTRSLVAAGAAAGIAAAFDAPIAGVFFAVEIVLGEIAGGALAVVLLSAVCSAAVTHGLVGSHPAFAVPPYSMQNPAELAAYLVLGLASGVVAAAYVTAIHGARDLAAKAPLPRWLRPAAAGLVVGAVGLALPGILGVGYPSIEAVLGNPGPGLGMILALLVGKLLATALCIGAGFQGGVFAPALFLGAMLGGAFGAAADQLVPSWGLEPAAFALVGMGAVLAGATHAPLTAILLLFEMTRDYAIMVPAMLAVSASWFVSRRLRRESVYTFPLARKGIRLERGRDVEVLDAIMVREVMQTEPPTVREATPALEALESMRRTRHLGLAVLDAEGALAGIVAAQDLDRAAAGGRIDGATVGDLCTRALLTAHPDETLAAALRRMSTRDIGRLPVVEPGAPRRLVGMLRRSDVVRAYDVALRRREVGRHRLQQARLGALTGIGVEEVRVEAGSACAGRRVSEVSWPRSVVLASVRRGDDHLVPKGETRLEASDVVIAVVEDAEGLAGLHRLCRPPGASAWETR